jgi:hypothetical protein
MGQEVLGAVGALLMLGLWSFVIWPAINNGLNKVGSIALEPRAPKADSSETLLLATTKARRIFNRHIESYLVDRETINNGIRKGTESQIAVLAFSVTLVEIAIQDVLYDSGKVDTVKLRLGSGGFPRVKISHDAFRAALRDVWSEFEPFTRMQLDARHTCILGKNLGTDAENILYKQIAAYASATLTNEFAYNAEPDTMWIQFVNELANDNIESARALLKGMSQLGDMLSFSK